MREHEIEIGTLIVEDLGGPGNAWFGEGDDPPDLFIRVNNDIVSLEVTSLEVIVSEYDTKNRLSLELPFLSIIEKNQEKLEYIVPDGFQVLIIFYAPFSQKDFANLKNKLPGILSKFMNHAKIGDSEELFVGNSRFTVRALKSNRQSERIAATVYNSSNSSNINAVLFTAMQKSLLQKEQKCKEIQGKKWLALDCRPHFLASKEEAIKAAQTLISYTTFDKVAIVTYNQVSWVLQR